MKIRPKKITPLQIKKLETLGSARPAAELGKLFHSLFQKRKSVYDLSFTQARTLIAELEAQPK